MPGKENSVCWVTDIFNTHLIDGNGFDQLWTDLDDKFMTGQISAYDIFKCGRSIRGSASLDYQQRHKSNELGSWIRAIQSTLEAKNTEGITVLELWLEIDRLIRGDESRPYCARDFYYLGVIEKDLSNTFQHKTQHNHHPEY